MPHLFFIIENICSSILNNLKYYNYEIMVNECFIKGSERRFYIQRKICDVKNNNFQIKRALSFLQRMTSGVLALYGDNGCPYAVQ